MLMVVNKVPATMDREALRAKVEKLYDAEVAGILPLNEEIVNTASGCDLHELLSEPRLHAQLGRRRPASHPRLIASPRPASSPFLILPFYELRGP